MTTAYLLNSPLSLESVRLGRLVLNARTPLQEYIDPLDGRPDSKELVQVVQRDYEETQKFSKDSKLRSKLKNILSISYERKSTGVATLAAPLATTYNLQNSNTWFKNACAQPETKKFLEDAIDDQRTVYLIVGFRTAYDARMVQNLTWKKTRGASGECSTNLITGFAPMNLASSILVPEAKFVQDAGNAQEFIYQAPGEQVFAIQYRKVKFKWFSSRKVDDTFLEVDNRWISCWNWRGYEEEEEDDILEATLTDVDDLDISDNEEYVSEDETDCPPKTPPGLAGKETDTEIHGTLDINAKRKRDQNSANETSKRLRFEY